LAGDGVANVSSRRCERGKKAGDNSERAGDAG
jgi:hypothetical protein